MSHPNARLTVHGRLLLVQRVRLDGQASCSCRPGDGDLTPVRAPVGRPVRCRGPGRAQAGRSSRPHRMPRGTPARSKRWCSPHGGEQRRGPAVLTAATGVPARTVCRILPRHGGPLLAVCDPITGQVIRASKTTAVRYERDRPGELVHIDVKKIGSIPEGGGWRAYGAQEQESTASKKAQTGYDYVHAAVDDYTRLAYAEILNDEKGTTCAGFLTRAAARFGLYPRHTRHRACHDRQRLENYRNSPLPGRLLTALGARQNPSHPTTLPLAKRQSRAIQPDLQSEWAYRQVFTTNDERTAALQPWVKSYNTQRPTPHSKASHPPPGCNQPAGQVHLDARELPRHGPVSVAGITGKVAGLRRPSPVAG